jgi:hypothetical protein
MAGINTRQNIEDATKAIMRSMDRMVARLGKQESIPIVTRAGEMIRDSIKSKVNVSKGPTKKYSRGRLYATYHPGNLKRSIQIFKYEFDKSVYVLVGPKMQPKGQSRGEFKGDRVDGKYAWYVEYGQRKRPFMRPGVDAVESQVYSMINSYVDKVLNARS